MVWPPRVAGGTPVPGLKSNTMSLAGSTLPVTGKAFVPFATESVPVFVFDATDRILTVKTRIPTRILSDKLFLNILFSFKNCFYLKALTL
jgi:hypothetical protein